MNPSIFILADALQAFNQFIPFIVLILLFYVIAIRPQQKRQKELQKQVDALKPNDQVVTAGGIHGRVASLGESTVKVKVDEGIKLEFEKSSIVRVIK